MVALRADMSRGPHENQIPRLNSDTLETTRQMKPRTSRDTDRRPSESRTASGSASKTIARFGSTSTAHSSRLPFAPVREIHHDMPAALTDRRFQRQQRSQPPQEHANDDRPEEEDTTCGHAEYHGERREAGVRLRDAGCQGPEPAEQAQPAEPGWEPPGEKHRDTEGRDGESEEHAEKTRQADLDLSHRKGAFEGARPSLATCLHPTSDHHLQRHAVDRLQRGRGRNVRCRSDDADPSPR